MEHGNAPAAGQQSEREALKLRRVVSYERLSASPAPTEEPRTDGGEVSA